MKKQLNLRSLTAQLVERVIDRGQSLSAILPIAQQKLNNKDSALLQELCFGIMRTLPQLEALIDKLMKRPMSGKQRILHYLLMVGLYQLIYTRIPSHAALSETVAGAVALKRPQLKGVINGVLRQFQRHQTELLNAIDREPQLWLHPLWLLQRLQQAWPQQWRQIITANNQRPPMWLRVNRQHNSRDNWLALLNKNDEIAYPDVEVPDAVRLSTPTAVDQLPGFERGLVTVQDLSAQRCAILLEPQNGEYILDLCAAPGGKTTHILEIAPLAKVLAVDVDTQRLMRINENLHRLNMQADVKQGDGRYPEAWCSGREFDRILLDAPCSASGVIRRHPDIKWLRRNSDIDELAKLQQEILDAIWPYLKRGGTLLYATCSVIPEENQEQIANFLSRHMDAIPTTLPGGHKYGWQLFPCEKGGDGFFFAKIIKN